MCVPFCSRKRILYWFRKGFTIVQNNFYNNKLLILGHTCLSWTLRHIFKLKNDNIGNIDGLLNIWDWVCPMLKMVTLGHIKFSVTEPPSLDY